MKSVALEEDNEEGSVRFLRMPDGGVEQAEGGLSFGAE